MEPFTLVLVGAIGLFVLVGFCSFVMGGSVYDRIGEGGLSAGPERPGGPPPGSPLEREQRQEEIRQMLQARSERQVRRGGKALDIDAELALLEAPAAGGVGKHDAGLAEEVRQLVTARNERRLRKGEDPVDVEAEVTRTLDELDPDGR